MPALNPASAVPLYAQLAEHLLLKIRSGDYPAGARIPSEHSLATQYGIGRPTVRQATETLIRRGVLARRRGAGTFVREQGAHVDLFSLGGTLRSFSSQGIELHTELLEAPRRLRLSAREQEHPLSGREVYRLTRRGQVDGKPVLLERMWFDAEVFPKLDGLDLAGRSLSEAVRQHYGMEPVGAEQSFRVEVPNSTRARSLGLGSGQPVLRVDRILHFPTASAAVFAQMHCRTDRFTFSQRIGGEHA